MWGLGSWLLGGPQVVTLIVEKLALFVVRSCSAVIKYTSGSTLSAFDTCARDPAFFSRTGLAMLADRPIAAALAASALAASALLLWRLERLRRRSAEAKLRELRAVLVLASVNNRQRTLESLRAGISFAARPTDVVVATFPKCGTTLLQNLVHQLRTGGSWDFAEISMVVPWLESCVDLGTDPAAQQAVASKRANQAHPVSCSEVCGLGLGSGLGG